MLVLVKGVCFGDFFNEKKPFLFKVQTWKRDI